MFLNVTAKGKPGLAFRVEFTVLKPSIWLLSAAMVFVAALCLHYYQAQMDATRTLAMKLGLPDTVAIEDFHRMRDSNQMGEVQLAAVVRPADTRPISGPGNALFLLPLYATDASFEDDSAAPFGFYVAMRDTRVEGIASFGLAEITNLGDSSLVNVIGTRLNGQSALSGTVYDFAPADIGLESGAFLVGGHLVERAARLGNGDVTAFRDTLFAVTLLLVAMAGVSQFHGRRQVVIGRPEQKIAPEAKSPRSKKAFAPLASQDEIRRTDEAERARRRRSRLSFASTFTSEPVDSLKNPQ